MGHDDEVSTRRPVDGQTAAQVAELMSALAAPSRVLILDRLRDAPMSVSELALAVGMEQSAVSHQLRLLRHLRLVTSRRQGRRIIYALHDVHVDELLDQAVAHHDHVRLDQPDEIDLPGDGAG